MGPSFFLDTSALFELCFRDRTTRENVLRSVPEIRDFVTSRYVLFELARGPVKNLVLLQRKACQVKGFSDLEEYAGRCFPAPHRLGTYLGAFTSFHREALPKVAMDDSQHLAFFKSHLESNIRRGWKKALKTADRTLNEIGCLEEIPPPKISPEDGHYLFDLPTPKCGQQKNCGLKAYMALNRDQFERIREHLSKLEPSDAETKKRIKALRALYRNPNQNFKRTECYQCGDALIAHEGRNDGIILTRNGKHFEPICDLLETQVLSY